MQPDPIFVIAAALAVAVILASAATHKLRAPARFASQLEDYQLLPQALVRPRRPGSAVHRGGPGLRPAGSRSPSGSGLRGSCAACGLCPGHRHQPLAWPA